MSSIGIADKYTLDLINTKIGQEGDAWALKTVFAYLKNINTYVTASYTMGSVKKVQNGFATAEGSVTISSVIQNKAVVHTVSVGSYGHVAARGKLFWKKNNDTKLYTIYQSSQYNPWDYILEYREDDHNPLSYTNEHFYLHNADSDTDLYTGQYSGMLTSNTTLYLTGPCLWQVVEYY